MNLQAITAGAVGANNPNVAGVLLRSAGYTTGDDGSQVPAYAPPVLLSCQVQGLTNKDLKQMDGLNIQGVKRAIYMQGDVRGVSSVQGGGGDLITFASSRIGEFIVGTSAINGAAIPAPDLIDTTWLVVTVLETWGTGWCKVGVTLQGGTP